MTFQPITVDADAPAIEDARIPAFTITKDGKPTEYTIPKEISGPTALMALEVFVRQGEDATLLWLVQHALGPEGYAAVLACEQLTLGQTKALLRAIGEQYIGQVKDMGKAQE